MVGCFGLPFSWEGTAFFIKAIVLVIGSVFILPLLIYLFWAFQKHLAENHV